MNYDKKIKNIIKWILPHYLINFFRLKLYKIIFRKLSQKKRTIKKYFLGLNKNEQQSDIFEIIEYFEKYDFAMIPYKFRLKYHVEDIKVFYDKTCNMYRILQVLS